MIPSKIFKNVFTSVILDVQKRENTEIGQNTQVYKFKQMFAKNHNSKLNNTRTIDGTTLGSAPSLMSQQFIKIYLVIFSTTYSNKITTNVNFVVVYTKC